MSLYNMMNGVNPATFFFLPMLGHHPDEFPRFRDCFLNDEDHPEYDDYIHVYTRTGGGNRDDYEIENEWIKTIDGFVADFDDEYDCTYASWVFKVPEKWRADFDLIKKGEIKKVSKEYQDTLRAIYPKLNEKFDVIFNSSTTEQDK